MEAFPRQSRTAYLAYSCLSDDHEKFAAALLDAAKDPGFLSRIARNGAEIVRKNFDLRAQAQRLEEIYLRTIQM